ncbi:hypothetical protein AAG906_017308 [Vitis piasezkii]
MIFSIDNLLHIEHHSLFIHIYKCAGVHAFGYKCTDAPIEERLSHSKWLSFAAYMRSPSHFALPLNPILFFNSFLPLYLQSHTYKTLLIFAWISLDATLVLVSSASCINSILFWLNELVQPRESIKALLVEDLIRPTSHMIILFDWLVDLKSSLLGVDEFQALRLKMVYKVFFPGFSCPTHADMNAIIDLNHLPFLSYNILHNTGLISTYYNRIELNETVKRMEESIPQVILFLDEAVERCISFTGGSEIDDIMLQYISTLQETLKSLRAVCGVDTGDGGGTKKEMVSDRKEGTHNARKVDLISNEEEWSIVQGALQILTVADCLTSRSAVFEASLKATLARLSTSLSLSVFGSNLDQNQSHVASDDGNGELSMVGRAALDVTSVQLVDVPQKARRLFNLLDQSKDPRFHALPLASQRVAAFADTVNELAYDVLISKVRQRLSDVSHLPIWSAVEEPSAFHLPSFNAYPQAYVTSVGEYLLTLPQQLEPLAEGIPSSDPNADEAQFFATEWMFKTPNNPLVGARIMVLKG